MINPPLWPELIRLLKHFGIGVRDMRRHAHGGTLWNHIRLPCDPFIVIHDIRVRTYSWHAGHDPRMQPQRLFDASVEVGQGFDVGIGGHRVLVGDSGGEFRLDPGEIGGVHEELKESGAQSVGSTAVLAGFARGLRAIKRKGRKRKWGKEGFGQGGKEEVGKTTSCPFASETDQLCIVRHARVSLLLLRERAGEDAFKYRIFDFVRVGGGPDFSDAIRPPLPLIRPSFTARVSVHQSGRRG